MPSSRWDVALDIMEEMGWTYDELLATPAELVDELIVRIQAKRFVEGRQAKRAEQQAQQQRHRRK